jgi:hypothetical protein
VIAFTFHRLRQLLISCHPRDYRTTSRHYLWVYHTIIHLHLPCLKLQGVYDVHATPCLPLVVVSRYLASSPRAKRQSQSQRYKMHILSLLTKIFSLPMLNQPSINNGTHAGEGSSNSMFSLTQHTQTSPSLPVELPSVTALATMPCTSFPGRIPYTYASPSTITPLLASIMGPSTSSVPRKRPEKRYAVSTYDLDFMMGKFGREMRWVEVWIVEWLVLCARCFMGGEKG